MLKKFSIAIGSLFAVFLIACSSDEASDIAGGDGTFVAGGCY